MEITHLIDFVEGPFETDTGELISVPHRKYGQVDLCFKGPMHIPFARIVLHTRDLAVDADQVFDSASALGAEITRRWNAHKMTDGEPSRAIICCFCGQPFAYPGAEPGEEVLNQAFAHEAACEKNPYLARIADLEKQVAKTRALVDASLDEQGR